MNLLSFFQFNAIPPRECPGRWDVRKERLKSKYPVLTDEDLVLTANNRDEMFNNLLRKLDKTADEMHAIIIAL